MSKSYLEKYSKCLSHTCGWTLKTHLGWWAQAVVCEADLHNAVFHRRAASPTTLHLPWPHVNLFSLELSPVTARLPHMLQPQGPCFPRPRQVASASFLTLHSLCLVNSSSRCLFSSLSLASTVSGVLCDQINPIYFCLSVVSVAKSCLTLWDLHGCSPPVSPVHGILQARLLEWIAISFSRGSSRPRDGTHVSCTGRWVLYCWASRKEPPPIKKKKKKL